ncbi:hypothetical protein Fmac_009416 [Flemingia macrophylla]|uniref:Uncharacterized protein n=1 Tax=Flemingia macrophylla TaxID=520843 RepID=A0ABD1N0R0_9FABA
MFLLFQSRRMGTTGDKQLLHRLQGCPLYHKAHKNWINEHMDLHGLGQQIVESSQGEGKLASSPWFFLCGEQLC